MADLAAAMKVASIARFKVSIDACAADKGLKPYCRGSLPVVGEDAVFVGTAPIRASFIQCSHGA